MRPHASIRMDAKIGITSRTLRRMNLNSSLDNIFRASLNSSSLNHRLLWRSSRTPKTSPMFHREKVATSSPLSARSKTRSVIGVPGSVTYRLTMVLLSR